MNQLVRVVDDAGHTHVIGHVAGDALVLPRKKSIHLFRKLDAWGVDRQIIEHLDVPIVVIEESEENVIYRTLRQTILDVGLRVHYAPHRPQIMLPRHMWEVVTIG